MGKGGTSEAAGISFNEMLDLIKILKNAKILGAGVAKLFSALEQGRILIGAAHEITFAILK